MVTSPAGSSPIARHAEEPARAGTLEEAARAICDQGDDLRIVSAMYPSQPTELLAAVVEEVLRRDSRVTIMAADLSGRFAFVGDDALAAGNVKVVTIGGRVPGRVATHGDNVPTSLWEIARRFESGQIRVDVFAGLAAPAGPGGHYSFGPMVSYAPAAAGAATFVALQVNEAIPPLPGYPGPAAADVDLVVERGGELVEFRRPKIGEQHERIGANLAQLIPDGATLQLGIGGIPEGFVKALAGKRQLGIHSGAIPEAAIDLIEAGVFSGERKAVDRGVHVTTSLLGTRRLYEFAADPANRIELRPVTETHDPAVLARQSCFFAVNSAFEIDLSGQVNAEVVDGSRASSGGGQVDFGKWAHANPDGGGNIVALPARAGDGRARIVAELSAPHVVTTHRSDVDFVVSEFGVADLRGRTADERAAALIQIAHPDDRPALRAAA